VAFTSAKNFSSTNVFTKNGHQTLRDLVVENLFYLSATGQYATEQTATLACNYIAAGHPKAPATEAPPLRRGSKET
jgi:hypothetical protein